jgi:hypothetical protein
MADISDPAQASRLVAATVRRFGRLDVLVNNASVRRQTKFADMTPEEWREIMGTTIDGAFYCAHAAAPHIIAAGGGTIINLGGISSHVGAVGRVHAITAKAGMVGLTRALAKELAPEQHHREHRRSGIDQYHPWRGRRWQQRARAPARQSGRPHGSSRRKSPRWCATSRPPRRVSSRARPST